MLFGNLATFLEKKAHFRQTLTVGDERAHKLVKKIYIEVVVLLLLVHEVAVAVDHVLGQVNQLTGLRRIEGLQLEVWENCENARVVFALYLLLV